MHSGNAQESESCFGENIIKEKKKKKSTQPKLKVQNSCAHTAITAMLSFYKVWPTKFKHWQTLQN